MLATGGTSLATPPSLDAPRHFELLSDIPSAGNSVGNGTVLDGDHVLFKASGSLAENDIGFGLAAYNLARRNPSGWAIDPFILSSFSFPYDVSREGGVEVFTDPKSHSSLDSDFFPGPLGEAGISWLDVYARDANGLRLVSTGSSGGNGEFHARYGDSSADGTHLLFQTEEVLEPDDIGRDPGTRMLYDRVDNETRTVGLDAAEQPLGSGGAVLAGSQEGVTIGQQGAVSDDGSRIFFESPDPVLGGNTQLYLRENDATTTEVSASQRSTPGNAPQPVFFQGAASDGSRVIFSTVGQLTDGDEDTSTDLYSYDVEDEDLTRITGGSNGEGENAEVLGVSAVSDDGERVYFVATGVLASGAELGALNYYVYDGPSDSTQLVGTVTVNDQAGLVQQGLGTNTPELSVTPDGSALVFHAEARLTDFDNETFNPKCISIAASSGRCVEVYLFRVGVPGVECLSCNASGLPPLGNAFIPTGRQNVLIGPRRPNSFISDDGSLVLFQTGDSLLPADTNQKEDVYLWQESQLSLITSGTSPEDSAVVGIGDDGRDLFFTTDEALLPQDGDQVTDLYDARTGAGFPQPPPPPLACTGDGCQGSVGGAPSAERVGSAIFSGNGNKRRRCVKGKVRRGNRCVRMKKPGRRKHRTHDHRRAGR